MDTLGIITTNTVIIAIAIKENIILFPLLAKNILDDLKKSSPASIIPIE